MLKVGFGLDEHEVNGSRKEAPCVKLCGVSPRHAMQTLGTEWGRNCIDKNIWLASWLHMKKTLGAEYVVADDIRFINEIELIRELGGEIFEVASPARGSIPLNHHVSEVEWTRAEPDWTIINDGDIESLRRKVEAALHGVSQALEEAN